MLLYAIVRSMYELYLMLSVCLHCKTNARHRESSADSSFHHLKSEVMSIINGFTWFYNVYWSSKVVLYSMYSQTPTVTNGNISAGSTVLWRVEWCTQQSQTAFRLVIPNQVCWEPVMSIGKLGRKKNMKSHCVLHTFLEVPSQYWAWIESDYSKLLSFTKRMELHNDEPFVHVVMR